MKKISFAPIMLFLFACSTKDKVDIGKQVNDLVGDYHSEVVTREEDNVILAKRIYHVKISTAKKTDKINIETREVYLFRLTVRDPLVTHSAPDIRSFEGVNNVDNKNFFIEEIRNTDWGNRDNATTNIRINGKLTDKELNVYFNLEFPGYNETRKYTWTLDKK